MKTYVVYILRCSDGMLYTGVSGNLEQRLIQHQQGYFRQCYTYRRRPVVLLYSQEFNDVVQAILLEKQVKGWTRVKKMALVNGDFDSIRLLAECRNHTNSKFHEN
ncbi:GIY-YIG nuclease family protein [uncultured Croceitalea sp.]|uniref:GIY-YIG nuclease family protein n=1 Tax=uncultured Croceitalea sp. TaxID=1798908 RepID=UPI00330560D4